MSNKTWRQIAAAKIRVQINEAHALGIDEPEALHRYVSLNYPFQERRGYAYKAWLQATREILGIVDTKTPAPIQTPDSVRNFWVKDAAK